MTDQSETYKGRKITVRSASRDAKQRRTAGSTTAEGAAEEQLYVDDKQVFVSSNSSGEFIASGLAYAPQKSLVELAKKLIDYADKVK